MIAEEFDLALADWREQMMHDKCPELMTQAIATAQDMGYLLGQARALLYRGEYLIDLGEQPTLAIKDFREASLIARPLRDWSLLAQTLHWQAQSQLLLGEYMRALDIWLQALQTAIEAEDSRAFIRGYSGIAQVCLVFNQLDVSLEYQRRALSMADNVDDLALKIDCLLALIATCYRLKLYDEMAQLLKRLHANLQARPNLETQAEFHIYTGLIAFDHQAYGEALEHLQLARILAQQFGGLWCRAYVALILGRIYLAQEQLNAAKLSLELCLRLGVQIHGFAMNQEAHQLLETLCAKQGDYQGALEHLQFAHSHRLNLLQKQAERKLHRISHKQLNQLELALRLALSRLRYST